MDVRIFIYKVNYILSYKSGIHLQGIPKRIKNKNASYFWVTLFLEDMNKSLLTLDGRLPTLK